MKPILRRVYICAPLAPGKYEKVSALLNLIPQEGCQILRPGNEQIGPKEFFISQDVFWIDQCDELWVIGPIGRDCSWEIGYAQAKGKHVKVFVDHSNAHLLDADWMFRWGLDKNTKVVDLRTKRTLDDYVIGTCEI